MISESLLTSLIYPKHWPVIALSGDNKTRRDELLAKIARELQKEAINALIIKDYGEILDNIVEASISPENGDVLYLDKDFYSTTTKRKTAGKTQLEENNDFGLLEIIRSHITLYDIIIVSTNTAIPIDTVKFTEGKGQYEEDSDSHWVVYNHNQSDDFSGLCAFLCDWLHKKIFSAPTWACVLIGGKSSRMGQPKHLLKGANGRTWLENTVEMLEAVVTQVVLSGNGEVPVALRHLPRMVDIADVKGPMTGLLSAMRWNPQVSWLLVACDMPHIRREGLQWLMDQKKAGVWGTVPAHQATGYLEPLLAHYDFRSADLFEILLASGCLRISRICEEPKIATPAIPQNLAASWKNCNTPEDLKNLK